MAIDDTITTLTIKMVTIIITNNNRFNGRGRGSRRGRNNYGYRNNSNNNQNNNGRNNWQNNNNNYVRYAENVPQQQVSLGFPNQQNRTVQNNQ